MVSARKRSLHEADEANGNVSEEPSLLHRIRNMWQFANLCQWIYIFGKAVKLDDDLDTEKIETECLKPDSVVLQQIGLALLKNVSSHRGLNNEIFDEYTRRQFVAKDPEINPFGTDETPAKFAQFDVFTKIRVLQQMTLWIMQNPERIREKMEESKDSEQTGWRIEPMGWDSEDRTYFVLDDNRVYRLTDAPPAPAPPKKKSKSSRKGQRATKRRRTSAMTDTEDHTKDPETSAVADHSIIEEPQDDGLGGMKWECSAVTLDEVRNLVSSFHKTRDANEKILRDSLQNHLVPILEKQEESRQRKALQRERELVNLAKMANAKRSSRLANKQEQRHEEEKVREEEERRRAEEAASRKAEQQRIKLEQERDIRLLSRERRLKEREARRLRHEDELSNLSEDSKQAGSNSGRFSGRRLQAEIEKNKEILRQLEQEEEDDDWIFDCVCGVYGQVDDGTHSIACEKCNVWQHSKCVGVSEEEAESPELHFICTSCIRRQEDADKPKPTIKLKLKRPDHAEAPTSPETQRSSEIDVEIPLIPSQQADRSHEPPSGQALEPNHNMPLDQSDMGNVGRFGHSSSFRAQGKHEGTDAKALTGETTDTTDNSALTTGAQEPGNSSVLPVTPGTSLEINGAPSYLGNGVSPTKTDPDYSAAGITPARALHATSSPTAGAQSLLATPVLSQEGKNGGPMQDSALPSSEAGHSPTKHSPAATRPQSSSSSKTNSVPAIFPPATMLAPSPQQPILTPPTKQAEPPRPKSPTATQSTLS